MEYKQWGTLIALNTVTFPIAFPNNVFCILTTCYGTSSEYGLRGTVGDISQKSFMSWVSRNGHAQIGGKEYWLALGK